MQPDVKTDPIGISRDFLHHFWNGDVEWCREMLDGGFTWIGTQEDQFAVDAGIFGKAQAATCAAIPRIILMDEEFEVSFKTEDTFVVTAQYLGDTNPSVSLAFMSRRRVTFVWHRTDLGLRLAHCHVSNPQKPSRDDEAFPVAYAQETHRYANMIATQKSCRHASSVRDVQGNVHMLRLYEVMYLEANRQSTVVHCVSKIFRVREGIASLAKTIMGDEGKGLVHVQRSFYVNALYVGEVGGEDLTLFDGTKIPVSGRRRAEVCEEIARACTGED